MDLTVVGGGLAGLTAAIASAEKGAHVTLLEAHPTLGGRARSTPAPYVANEGPHVLYSDSAPFAWLAERGLLPPLRRIPPRALVGSRFRYRGRLGAPPAGLLWAAAHRGLRAPHDVDFTTWAAGRFGPDTAAAAAHMMGVVVFDHDPGRLSASFVWDRFLRVASPRLPSPRYPVGGWSALVEHMAARARARGVRIETGTRVDRLPDTPVIVATSLAAARTLLGDDSLTWESGHSLLVDVGLRQGRDPFLVLDADQCGFLERQSLVDPTLAPSGESVVQAQMPVRPGESRAAVTERLEELFDDALPEWRERLTWRRDQVARDRTGAIDLPGSTWRDRPAVDRGDGVYLAGDCVAAPGLLSEVSVTSAVAAAGAALSRGRTAVR
ncbi:FAD-dependent oxidoreductase [Nocardiopsis sp. YSL2]|uniref:FAD-dependent oxidoreductase n=1 Tax=Nocardiopsis sp. YSL2 TaxID=2939492 RepID=UPI0026F47372|nr:FAD-dependent oxidoreductase [Nocardiopsis sp. YSL2]